MNKLDRKYFVIVVLFWIAIACFILFVSCNSQKHANKELTKLEQTHADMFKSSTHDSAGKAKVNYFWRDTDVSIPAESETQNFKVSDRDRAAWLAFVNSIPKSEKAQKERNKDLEEDYSFTDSGVTFHCNLDSAIAVIKVREAVIDSQKYVIEHLVATNQVKAPLNGWQSFIQILGYIHFGIWVLAILFGIYKLVTIFKPKL